MSIKIEYSIMKEVMTYKNKISKLVPARKQALFILSGGGLHVTHRPPDSRVPECGQGVNYRIAAFQRICSPS
mgnify:CR=1 FL=1